MSDRKILRAIVLVGLALRASVSTAPADELADRLDRWARDAHPDPNAPGAAVLVMIDGKPVLRKGYGMASIESGEPVTPDMIFRIGSITKQFTSVAVLQLVQGGKLALEDPLSKYVPDFDTQGKVVTIANLLSHTSGIPNVTALETFDAQITRDLQPRQTVDLVAGMPMEFEPGSRFKYSNTNYLLLGVIIEKVSGESYADYLQNQIAKPLGLADTRYSRDDALGARHARGYERDKSGRWAAAPPLSMTQPYAAGAIESTVDDLARWTASLNDGKVIDPALLQRAWTPFPTTERPSRYGFGWNIRNQPGETWVNHGGAINGFMSTAVWIPEKRVFVAVLRNSLGESSPERLMRQLTLEALGRPEPVREAITLPVKILERYTGVYAAEPELKFTVTRTGQKLFIAATGKTKLELFAEAEGKFFCKEIDLQVEFAAGDGKAGQITVTRNGRPMIATREK